MFLMVLSGRAIAVATNGESFDIGDDGLMDASPAVINKIGEGAFGPGIGELGGIIRKALEDAARESA